jgi:hypothetical protein
LEVIAKYGKKAHLGHLIRKDYLDAIRIHLDQCELKYRAENIMKKYGIECLRLPPYHPELTALGNTKKKILMNVCIHKILF